MLNIIIVLVASYLLLTLLTAVLCQLINKIYRTTLDLGRIVEISNAGLGVSLMLSFMSMLVILQLDIKAEQKTIYLFFVFLTGYLLTVFISLYSHIVFIYKNK